MNVLGRLAGPGIAGHAAALLAGALLPAALAPFDIWPLAVLCPLALLALLRRPGPAVAALRAWSFGVGMFGTGASWVYVSIHQYGSAPVPLAAFLTLLFCLGLALFPALTFWAWARWVRERPGGVLFGFTAAWVLGEWWRGWFLTGFPWLYAGYSQLEAPLAGWAPVLGVLGIGLILAFTAAALYLTLTRTRGGPAALAASALLWTAGPLLERAGWTVPAGEPLSVAMVQGNIAQELKWEPGQLEAILDTYVAMSEPLWGTDLVVWPEAAVPAYLDLVVDKLAPLAARAVQSDSTLLLGIPTRDANETRRRGFDAFNSIAVIGTDSGLYHKRRLVPFGEYVPLEPWLRGLIAFFDLPMSSFSSGPAEQAPLTVRGLRVAPSICYEIVYPDLVGAGAAQAELLLTVSNDTWFGASIGPLQHLQMARMRALETGRPLIRATNNGISALIDDRGRLLVRGGQFTQEVIRGDVQPTTGLTPFARWGSWCALLLAVLPLLAAQLLAPPGAALARRRIPRQRHRLPVRGPDAHRRHAERGNQAHLLARRVHYLVHHVRLHDQGRVGTEGVDLVAHHAFAVAGQHQDHFLAGVTVHRRRRAGGHRLRPDLHRLHALLVAGDRLVTQPGQLQDFQFVVVDDRHVASAVVVQAERILTHDAAGVQPCALPALARAEPRALSCAPFCRQTPPRPWKNSTTPNAPRPTHRPSGNRTAASSSPKTPHARSSTACRCSPTRAGACTWGTCATTRWAT